MRTFGCALAVALLLATALPAAEPAPAKPAPPAPVRVAILLYDGVQVLDVAGPLEVFTGARDLHGGGAAFDVYLVAERAEPITSNNTGKVYVPRYTLPDMPAPQILIVPGGDTRAAEANPALIEAIRGWSGKTELTASVCTGAFLLAKAGLLSGKPATTHWYFLDRLKKEYPGVDVQRDTRFVDAGKIMTSAGISAGIDMSLKIVERYLGQEAADMTARVMQYECRR